MSIGALREVRLKFQSSSDCWRFLLYLNLCDTSIQGEVLSGVLNEEEIRIACSKFDAQPVTEVIP